MYIGKLLSTSASPSSPPALSTSVFERISASPSRLERFRARLHRLRDVPGLRGLRVARQRPSFPSCRFTSLSSRPTPLSLRTPTPFRLVCPHQLPYSPKSQPGLLSSGVCHGLVSSSPSLPECAQPGRLLSRQTRPDSQTSIEQAVQLPRLSRRLSCCFLAARTTTTIGVTEVDCAQPRSWLQWLASRTVHLSVFASCPHLQLLSATPSCVDLGHFSVQV